MLKPEKRSSKRAAVASRGRAAPLRPAKPPRPAPAAKAAPPTGTTRRAPAAGHGVERPAQAAVPASGAPSIASLQAHSLPGLVQRELERMILGGDIAPGSKLNEAALADLLGVSRGPVREAFRALEELGLVRFEKNRGVYVRQIPVEEADQIYELRAVLDDFVGRRVAETAGPEEVRVLREHIGRMESAAAEGNVDGYLRANLEFHEYLVALTGNAKLLLTYRRLVNELRLFRRLTLAHGDTLAVSAREHREIVDQIAAGKAVAAGRALYDHVMASNRRMHSLHGGRALALKAAKAPRPAGRS